MPFDGSFKGGREGVDDDGSGITVMGSWNVWSSFCKGELVCHCWKL